MTVMETLAEELPRLIDNLTAAVTPGLPRDIFTEDLPMVWAEMERYEQLLTDATVEARQLRSDLERLAAGEVPERVVVSDGDRAGLQAACDGQTAYQAATEYLKVLRARLGRQDAREVPTHAQR